MNLIIEEIQKGNRKVFQNFFNKNYKQFVSFGNNYLFDQQASEDIVQDLFIYVWENANTINITSSLNSYMHTSIKNRCLNYLKSIKLQMITKF